MLALCMVALEAELDAAERVITMASAAAGAPVAIIREVSPAGEGWVKPTNRAIQQALSQSADFVALLQTDFMSFSRGWGARMIAALDAGECYGLAGPSVRCGTRPQCHGRPGLDPEERVVDMICYTAVVIRREVFEDIGALDESYIHYGADYDHVRRAQQRGWRAIYVPDVYIGHAWGGPLRYPKWKEHDARIYYTRWPK